MSENKDLIALFVQNPNTITAEMQAQIAAATGAFVLVLRTNEAVQRFPAP